MIKAVFGEDLDATVYKLFPFLFWRPLDPNTLTVLGAVVASAAGFAFASGSLRLGACVLLVGGFFDLVDGVVARHRGISTTFGAFLDSTLDRLVDVVVMAGLICHFAIIGADWTVLAATIALASTVLTSYAKARAELEIGSLTGGLLERGERIGLVIAGGILGIMGPMMFVLALGTTITVAQRFSIAYRAMEQLDRDNAVAGDAADAAASEPTGGA